jgi:hypothetical protein
MAGVIALNRRQKGPLFFLNFSSRVSLGKGSSDRAGYPVRRIAPSSQSTPARMTMTQSP